MFNVDIVLRKIKNNTWDKDAAKDMSKIVDLINNFLIQLPMKSQKIAKNAKVVKIDKL